MTEVGRSFGRLARWSSGVGGVLLLALGGWLAITEPPVTVADWTLVSGMACWGAAGVVFSFTVPRARSGRWRAFVVLAVAPVLGYWVVRGPVALVAPGWVADPGTTTTRWPRTAEAAASQGVFFCVLAVLVVVLFAGGLWADRRVERRRHR